MSEKAAISEPAPLEDLSGSYGAQVPITKISQAERIISDILLPDAIKTLSRLHPEEGTAVIEIRGKVCTHHVVEKGFRHFGRKCPDDHKGRMMCGIAWIYFDGDDALNGLLPDEPLFDFDGTLKPMEAGIYYELARIKINLVRPEAA